jgi:hypothetical protein
MAYRLTYSSRGAGSELDPSAMHSQHKLGRTYKQTMERGILES